MKSIFLFVVIVALCAIVAEVFGAWSWQNISQDYRATLIASQQPITPAAYNSRELEVLPAPVQKYFRSVLTKMANRCLMARVHGWQSFSARTLEMPL
jgi:hypothetical protein